MGSLEREADSEKRLLNRRVSIAWLLLVLIGTAAFGITWNAAVLKAPPPNAVLIEPLDESTSQVTPAPSVETEVTPAPTKVVFAASPTLQPTPETIAVYVSGAVAQPDVYALPNGSRVADALTAAGGPLPEADLERINLAAHLFDEEHISVPRKGETPLVVAPSPTPRPQSPAEPTATNRTTTSSNGQSNGTKININTASAAQLEELPGIGPVLAERIVQYRQENGPFTSIEDLVEVKGIGDAVMEKLRDQVTVGE